MESFTLDLEQSLSKKKFKRRLFPTYQLSIVDYFIGGLLFVFCYFSFVHADIYLIGWSSLNYLFGHPLDFYDNCKKFISAGYAPTAAYPPSAFAIFALWLYPFKAVGLIKSPIYFPVYLVYWLKVLTSIVYVITGFVFYKITQIYNNDKTWGKYATWLWLTTPMALFSQVIFSQCDIFYTFLTLIGFLFFLRYRIYLASFILGVAVTFKYFPFFVFLPLLVFFEKKILRLTLAVIIFSIPIFLSKILYGNSPAFIEGVLHFFALPRVFSASMDVGLIKIYALFLVFSILLGVSYSLSNNKKNSLQIAAYIFLISSILPFLFIFCHPGWVIFFTPAIVLTTMFEKKNKINKFILLDLAGMIVFISYIFILFQDNVDASMFQTNLFHIPFNNNYKLSYIFKIFGGGLIENASVFFSGFVAYLCLQIILKYPHRYKIKSIETIVCFYRNVRTRYYFGLLIFIIPVIFAVYINHTPKYVDTETNSNEFCVASLRNRLVGDKLIYRCPIFSLVSQFLSTRDQA